ncbi:MAG: ATP-binding protein [Acidobacteriota bacterium]
MRRSLGLSARLTLALLGLLLVLGAVTLGVTLVTSHIYGQQVQQELNRGLARELVEEQLPLGPDGVRREALDAIFHSLMVINPDIEVYLLDPSGRILEFSAPPGRVRRDRVSMAPIEKFLRAREGEGQFPILGDDPRHPEERKIFSVAPIPERPGEGAGGPERHLGYLYVVLAGEQVESLGEMVQDSYIVRLGLWIAAGSLLLALIGGGLLFRRLTRRLRSLAQEMGEFAGFGAGRPGRGDEIEQLRRTFHRLTGRIETQIEQLRENDRLRRELVANVSHDLRTPITHLQGYLETLQLKEKVVGPEERREYLEIATHQAERLGRLVADLFELAKLDARQAPLDIEVFSMAELVQDVVQKFRFVALQRNVTIEPELSASPGMVSADLDLIERVLDNLIDNALRHTPAGGTVTVSVRELTAEGREKIAIEVIDTGPGIDEADMPYIFDRFYRSGRSGRGAPPARHPEDREAGTGLGLAIAKRALELHASDLSCDSAPGHGAAFHFELQPAEITGPPS